MKKMRLMLGVVSCLLAATEASAAGGVIGGTIGQVNAAIANPIAAIATPVFSVAFYSLPYVPGIAVNVARAVPGILTGTPVDSSSGQVFVALPGPDPVINATLLDIPDKLKVTEDTDHYALTITVSTGP